MMVPNTSTHTQKNPVRKQEITPEQLTMAMQLLAAQMKSAHQKKTSAPPRKKRKNFGQIQRNVLRGKGIFAGMNMGLRGLIAAIIDYCDQHGQIFMSLEHLAEEIGTSTSTLSRYIQFLVDEGILLGGKEKYKGSGNPIWHLQANSEYIWEDNEKVYGGTQDDDSSFFAYDSSHFDSHTPSDWDDMASVDGAQFQKSHPILTDELDTSSNITDTNDRVRVGVDEMTPPALKIFLKHEKNVTPPGTEQPIQGLSEEKKKYVSALVPVIAKILNIHPSAYLKREIAKYTRDYPQLNLVKVARNAIGFAHEHNHEQASARLFAGTCKRWVEWEKFDPADEMPAAPSGDFPGVPGSLRSSLSGSDPSSSTAPRKQEPPVSETDQRILELYPDFELLDNNDLFQKSPEEAYAYEQEYLWRMIATKYYQFTGILLESKEQALDVEDDVKDWEQEEIARALREARQQR